MKCLMACHNDLFCIFSNRLLVIIGDVMRLKVSMQHCESVKISTKQFGGQVMIVESIDIVSALVEED